MLFSGFISDTVPIIQIGTGCAHHLSKNASCQACIDVCAQQAISIGPNQIVIDPDRCNGCGNCLFTCPTDALNGTAPLRGIRRGELIVDDSPAPSASELLQLVAHHHLHTIVAPADSAWRNPFETANRLLKAIGRDGIQWRDSDSGSVQQVSRRALFRRVGRYAAAVQAKVGGSALLRAYPNLSWHHIALDYQACTLCMACTRICPHQALRIEQGTFIVDSGKCTGCQLCHDCCLENALTVSAQVNGVSTKSMPLQQDTCRGCGRSFYHWPDRERAVCHICHKRELLYGKVR